MRKLELRDISTRYLGYRFQDAQVLQDYAKDHEISYELKEFLKDAQQTVKHARSFVDVKEFSTYENSGLPIEALHQVDQYTPAQVLLLTSPFARYPSTEEYMLKDDTIWEIKDRLMHRTRRGGALVLPNAPTRHEKIAQALHAYDRQIVDLAKERETISPDLFFYHMDERYALVKEHQQEIIECLCSLEASPIWGNLSMKQRTQLISGIRSKMKNKPLEKTLKLLAQYMTEYEICHDIEKGLGKVIKK